MPRKRSTRPENDLRCPFSSRRVAGEREEGTRVRVSVRVRVVVRRGCPAGETGGPQRGSIPTGRRVDRSNRREGVHRAEATEGGGEAREGVHQAGTASSPVGAVVERHAELVELDLKVDGRVAGHVPDPVHVGLEGGRTGLHVADVVQELPFGLEHLGGQ